MREILARNLAPLFDNLCFMAKCTWKGRLYEVWEVDDIAYKYLRNIIGDPTTRLHDDCDWVYVSGSTVVLPQKEMLINNRPLIVWYNEKVTYGNGNFPSLLDYLQYHIGATSMADICACAHDIAADNDMTVGELFRLCQGSK